MVDVALQAAEELSTARGKEAEVIDLRTLSPLDMDTIVESVKKTSRAVVVEERWKTGGFAGEVASAIQEAAFDDLDGPVARIGGLDVPSPYAAGLESAALPDADAVLDTIARTFAI
jgi:pyruvate dehydrogenase E1 component beta subunit